MPTTFVANLVMSCHILVIIPRRKWFRPSLSRDRLVYSIYKINFNLNYELYQPKL